MMDPFLSGIIEKRISAVLNKKLCFEINEKEDHAITGLIKTKNFRELLRQKMLRKFWGLAGEEFIPGDTFAFNPIPKKNINPKLHLITHDEYGQDGLPYDGIWNLWVTGTWDDLGILLQCAAAAILKRGVFSDYAQFIEVFGQPLMVFLYDAFDQKTKLELDTVMRNMGSSTRVSMPKQAQIDIKDAGRFNADGALQNKFIDICNREMSVKILGATETTQSSSSSGHAQSTEHGKQQDETIKSDLIDIANELNDPHFFRILESYGYTPGDGHFYFKDETDIVEVKAKLDILAIVAKNTPVADDEWYKISGTPKPDNYDELKTKMEEQRQAAIQNANNNNPDNGNNTPPKKDKKQKQQQKTELQKKLTGLSTWEKIKAVFSEAR
jgi:hypothetical protein